MIKDIMKNIGTEKAGMPEKLKQAYIDHAKKIGVDSLESLIRNKDKAYVDYNDEIAQIYADELKARNAKETEKDEFDSAGKKRPSTDVAYLKGSEDPQLKEDVKKAIAKHHATGNNLLNVLYSKDKELYKKLDAMGTTNAEQFINQLAYDPEYDSEEK